MARTPEGLVKAKVVKLLKAAGVYYFYASTHGFGRSGVPDLVCCLEGHFVAIECKAGKNKPTPLQEKEMSAIRASCGTTLVVNENNINDVQELIDEHRSRNSNHSEPDGQ